MAPALPDPDDDFILELAVAADCRYIVMHNLRDFLGSEKWGIVAITPSDFLKLRDIDMSTVTIQMPESLAQQIREWAAREGVSVDQLLLPLRRRS